MRMRNRTLCPKTTTTSRFEVVGARARRAGAWLLVRVRRRLGQLHGRVAADRGAGERVDDLRAVAVEVAGGERGEAGGRAGVVVHEQAVLIDLEVERLPGRFASEAGGDRLAVV